MIERGFEAGIARAVASLLLHTQQRGGGRGGAEAGGVRGPPTSSCGFAEWSSALAEGRELSCVPVLLTTSENTGEINPDFSFSESSVPHVSKRVSGVGKPCVYPRNEELSFAEVLPVLLGRHATAIWWDP